jgi:hypothetical protein
MNNCTTVLVRKSPLSGSSRGIIDECNPNINIIGVYNDESTDQMKMKSVRACENDRMCVKK